MHNDLVRRELYDCCLSCMPRPLLLKIRASPLPARVADPCECCVVMLPYVAKSVFKLKIPGTVSAGTPYEEDHEPLHHLSLASSTSGYHDCLRIQHQQIQRAKPHLGEAPASTPPKGDLLPLLGHFQLHHNSLHTHTHNERDKKRDPQQVVRKVCTHSVEPI